MDHPIRSADVVARTPCHVLELEAQAVYTIFKRKPRIFGIILLNIARMMSKRMSASNQVILNLRQQRARAETKKPA